jgi:hypothetical protein
MRVLEQMPDLHVVEPAIPQMPDSHVVEPAIPQTFDLHVMEPAYSCSAIDAVAGIRHTEECEEVEGGTHGGHGISLGELHLKMAQGLKHETVRLEGELRSLQLYHDMIENETVAERSSRLQHHAGVTFWDTMQVKHPLMRVMVDAAEEQFEFYPKRYLVLLLFSALLGELAASATFWDDDVMVEGILVGNVWSDSCEYHNFTMHPNSTSDCMCGQEGGAEDCYFLIVKALIIAVATTVQLGIFDGIFSDSAAAQLLEHRLELLACEEWMNGTDTTSSRKLILQVKEKADEFASDAEGKSPLYNITITAFINTTSFNRSCRCGTEGGQTFLCDNDGGACGHS